MISDFKQIEQLIKELDDALENSVTLFMIGGAVMLYHGLKPATKDIDVVVASDFEFNQMNNALKKMRFKQRLPSIEYSNLDLSQIYLRDDFRIDLFDRKVCGGFIVSEDMAARATTVLELENIKLKICSKEDIFLFKSMTEREGDLDDSIALAKTGLDWKIVLDELKKQIKYSVKHVWITWVGERFDLLIERGLNIPIMKDIDKLRTDYFKKIF